MAVSLGQLGKIYGGGGTYAGQAAGDLAGARGAGYFDPNGSATIFRQTRNAALRSGDNLRRRNAILARLMGLDPNQARVAQVNADATAGGNTAEALNQSQLQQSLGNQNYFRGLFGSQLGQENQLAALKYQHDLNQPSIGGQIGSLVGMGAGAFLGGPGGAALGSRLGGAFGGGGGGGGVQYGSGGQYNPNYRAYGP